MGTPHNNAEIGQIAKNVIMPGDPNRAKLIAEKYLENYKLVNDVRKIFAYTRNIQRKRCYNYGIWYGNAKYGNLFIWTF